jgi:hypothetical protein
VSKMRSKSVISNIQGFDVPIRDVQLVELELLSDPKDCQRQQIGR